MSERGGNASVPQLLLSGYFFDLSVRPVGCRHDECPEVCWLEEDDVVIVFFALVMIVASGQKVCLLVECAGFVS